MSEFLMKGHFYDSKYILGPWMLSTKLDGMSALWDGGYSRGMRLDQVPFANEHKVKNPEEITCTGLWSRMGKVVQAPDWFLDAMPDIMTVGELWAGPGKFQQTISTVRKKDPVDEEWAEITYNVFDAPNRSIFTERAIRVANGKYWVIPDMEDVAKSYCINGGKLTYFEDVYELLENLGIENQEVKLCKQTKIDSGINLIKRRDNIISKGGEGLVLRHRISVWTPERTKDLFKMKGLLDCHCEVIGSKEGSGRNKGVIGSWLVKVISGEEELIGKTFYVNAKGDDDRLRTDRVGTEVKVWYRELTDAGIPKDGRLDI